jgi:protein-S-isoprenylcysteine O-methyltransferase Ste14
VRDSLIAGRPPAGVQPPARLDRLARAAANVAGAAGAAFFARATLQFYLHTHVLIGAAFFVEQLWFVIVFLIRRPPKAATRRLDAWLLAFAGTFAGVLFRPVGLHPQWGIDVGLGVQVLGLAICGLSLAALGRSFGFAPANRGLAASGPYRVVRHPLYASYVLLQAGYLLQSMALWNVLVMIVATGCNIGRIVAEERLLGSSADYAAYRRRVRWRLLPGLW